jgi:hypothetical protein
MASARPGFRALWSIDANAAWTPEVAAQYLPVVNALNAGPLRVYMVEQPFPADVLASGADLEPWRAVAAAYKDAGCV